MLRAIIWSIPLVCSLTAFAQNNGGNNGYEIIRIPTDTHGKCINSKTDQVTLSVYRVILDKKGGFLTSDQSAGIAVIATLNGTAVQVNPPATPGGVPATTQVTSTTPQVSLVKIAGEQNGQIFVPLEYPIASRFALSQNNAMTTAETTSMQLKMYAEKARDKNTFGTIVTDAATIIKALPIPANPYLSAANTFLDFANTSIQDDAANSKNAVLFASINLPFADSEYADSQSCINHGGSYTGAVAILAATGAQGKNLLTLGNLSQKYCWRYRSESTFEIQYAPKPANGCSSLAGDSQWNEPSNNYTMLLLTAEQVPSVPPAPVHAVDKNKEAPTDPVRLCERLGVKVSLCGVK